MQHQSIPLPSRRHGTKVPPRVLTLLCAAALAACGGADESNPTLAKAPASPFAETASSSAPAPADKPISSSVRQFQAGDANASWVWVAVEGASIDLPDARPYQLRYGTADTQWLYKSTYNGNQGVVCSNEWFGQDPAPGTFKACEIYRTDTTAAPASAPSAAGAPKPRAPRW